MTVTEPVAEQPTAAAGTPVTTTVDVEAQKDAPAPAAEASKYDDEAGKGIGIALLACLVVGFCSGWIPGFSPYIRFVCVIASIFLSSIITCGCCCCGKGLKNLNPKVKRWATATLLCLVLQLVPALIVIIVRVRITASATTTVYEWQYLLLYASFIVSQILFILAALFAGIFTWGRKSCGNA